TVAAGGRIGIALASRLAARAARRLRIRAGRKRGARASARTATPRTPPDPGPCAAGPDRHLSGSARRRARDGGGVALADSEGGSGVRRAADQSATARGDRGLADDNPARPPLRGDPGVAASTRPCRQRGTDGREPREAGNRQPTAAPYREATIRVLG